MIDTTLESVFPLSQAPDELPRRRRGRKIHVSTLHRWATSGCRGIVLETISVGACRCTSREALQRFFERLSAPEADATRPAAVPIRSVVRRRREAERAGIELERMGA